MEYRNAIELASGGFDVELNHPVHGWIPYAVTTDDPDNSDVDSIELHALISAGDYEAYVAPTAEELLEAEGNNVRSERNRILRNVVDPVVTNVLRWGDLDAEARGQVEAYRKALLDITAQPTFPEVEWPSKPEVL